MTENQAPQEGPPSFRELQPLDHGGAHARRGFSFQDHVAAAHCLDMLDDAGPDEVWCETLDDIVLYWEVGELVEYVQAKSTSHPEWTLARVCHRSRGRTGDSLVERSLARDRARESAHFKIVTSAPVHADLRPLVRVRAERSQVDLLNKLHSLSGVLAEKLGPGTASPNGRDLRYWVENCHWDVKPEEVPRHENEKRIMEAAEASGAVLTTDQAGEIYARLLRLVKDAALADHHVQPSTKRIVRSDFRAWLSKQVEGARGTWQARPGSGLAKKFVAAQIPDSELDGAEALRTQYRLERLKPRYLDSRGFAELEIEIEAELRLLRSRVDAEILPDDGLLIHNKSLECGSSALSRLGLTNLPIHLAQGFVYELTDRCPHRYRRAGAL